MIEELLESSDLVLVATLVILLREVEDELDCTHILGFEVMTLNYRCIRLCFLSFLAENLHETRT